MVRINRIFIMKLGRLSSLVGDSPTLALNAKTAQLKKQGLPVIHLGGGEPEYPAPITAVDAIIKKAQSRKIKYSPSSGGAELKAAVAAYTRENYGIEVQNSNIIISSGAKQAIYNFLVAALDAGDEVVFPAPYWVSYPDMVKLAGGTPVAVLPESGVTVSFEQIKKAITPKTKVVIINSPGNPSGTTFSEEFIKNIVELCERKQIFLLTDDIYHKLTFGVKFYSPFKYAKNTDNIASINGVSKLYGLTGLRIGWAVSTNKELIAAMGRIQAQTTSCNSDVSEAAALAALSGPQDEAKALRNTLQENRNILMAELGKIPNIKVSEPQGAFYSFVDFGHYNKDSLAFAAFLLEKVLVAVVPGGAFGMEGYARISFCASKENISQGIKRINWALTGSGEMRIGNKIVKKEW
jgi:aspartate aminotransferase